MPAMKENKINTLFEFTVEGQHDFPFDMLRFDRCWPRKEEDTPNLAYWPRGKSDSKRQVRMTGLRMPTEGRWNSFGWKIIESHVVRVA